MASLLDSRPARVVEAYDRATDFQSIVHQVADLLGVDAAQRAAAHSKVLAECGHEAAIHHAGARHHAVARQALGFQAEMVAIMVGVKTPFLEGACLEELV